MFSPPSECVGSIFAAATMQPHDAIAL